MSTARHLNARTLRDAEEVRREDFSREGVAREPIKVGAIAAAVRAIKSERAGRA